jgi:RNA polymerase-binding transcription factor DksA
MKKLVLQSKKTLRAMAMTKAAGSKTALAKIAKLAKMSGSKAAGSKAAKKPVIHEVKVYEPVKRVKIEPVVKKRIKKYKKNSKVRYTARELIHFKKVVTDEKKKIYESAKANMRSLVDSDTGDYVGDDLSYATHMAEQGTDEMEREKNYLFVQRDEKYLGYLEDALTRIDQGTYGLCIECTDEPKNFCPTCPLIPKERLEIVPITQHCIECKNMRG